MNITLENLPANAFLRLPQVMAIVGLRHSAIYDLINRRRFPAQHKLTSHASGWRVGELRVWLANPEGWRSMF
jgi:predicted DNA-binding transcriptional regulator AlpA